MVVAFIALLVALGGTGYAAQQLKSNSVGSKQLKNNAVTTKKIKNGAVNSNKVRNGSLDTNDFKSGQLPAGPQGPRGAEGPRGVEGARGAQGPQGPAGTALAYAEVNPGPVGGEPSFVQARTSGFSTLTRPAGGRYCLELDAALVDQAFSNGVPTRPTAATLEYLNSTTRGAQATVEVFGAPDECPPNTFQVGTFNGDQFTNDVSFTLIVP
jgi:hypothetical protein